MGKKSNSYSEYKKSQKQVSYKRKNGSDKKFDLEKSENKKSSSSKGFRFPFGKKNSMKQNSILKDRSYENSNKKSKPKKNTLSKDEKASIRLENKEKMISSIKDFRNGISAFAKKFLIFVSLIVIVTQVIFIIKLNSKLESLQFDINKMNTKISKDKEIIKELNTKKENAYKSETIENFARYKLGMVYPKKEQIVYINLY